MGLKEDWEKFAAGHWTQDRPNRPGLWAVAERDASEYLCLDFLGFTTISVYLDPRSQLLTQAGAFIAGNFHWGGWFWSEPVPLMPLPPAWTKESE